MTWRRDLAVPAWMSSLTAAQYDALPEDVSRTIAVIDGAVAASPAPSRWHQDVARRIANALEAVLRTWHRRCNRRRSSAG
jgi:Uma2 family endonuclease